MRSRRRFSCRVSSPRRRRAPSDCTSRARCASVQPSSALMIVAAAWTASWPGWPRVPASVRRSSASASVMAISSRTAYSTSARGDIAARPPTAAMTSRPAPRHPPRRQREVASRSRPSTPCRSCRRGARSATQARRLWPAASHPPRTCRIARCPRHRVSSSRWHSASRRCRARGQSRPPHVPRSGVPSYSARRRARRGSRSRPRRGR